MTVRISKIFNQGDSLSMHSQFVLAVKMVKFGYLFFLILKSQWNLYFLKLIFFVQHEECPITI